MTVWNGMDLTRQRPILIVKGAKLGIYANMVADNIARYMVPQECGAKEEVRWAKVTDRKGRGMLF